MAVHPLRAEHGLVQLPLDGFRLLQPDLRVIGVEVLPLRLLFPNMCLYGTYSFGNQVRLV